MLGLKLSHVSNIRMNTPALTFNPLGPGTFKPNLYRIMMFGEMRRGPYSCSINLFFLIFHGILQYPPPPKHNPTRSPWVIYMEIHTVIYIVKHLKSVDENVKPKQFGYPLIDCFMNYGF